MGGRRPAITVGAVMLAILLASFVAGCGNAGQGQTQQAPMQQDEAGNFVLYVSNQSFAINPVDITVLIDGREAVRADFDVAGPSGPPQHNWVKHQFSLAPGTHKLTVTSKKGGAVLEQDFEITGKDWAVINYWYYPEGVTKGTPTPRHFTFQIQDTPIAFM